MEKLAENVWKLSVDSNLYLLTLKKNILIDTGPEAYGDIVKKEISNVLGLDKIEIVIFTHLHYDHIGNFNLFKKARFYTSAEEIASFRSDPLGTVLDGALVSRFNITLTPLVHLDGLEMIKTPGHTVGSICLFYPNAKILFSGDSLFNAGFGRTDLPNSIPGRMEESLVSLKKIRYNLLAPGHDY